jgi:hypothetical protein
LISRAPPGSLVRIEHHKLLEVLGRGALGVVSPPFDGASCRWAAVKVVVTPLLKGQTPAKKEKE